MKYKTAFALILVSTVGISPVFATDYGNYEHSQGNGYQCATGPTQQLECQIMNILGDLLPKILTQMQMTNTNLQSEIENQKVIIQNQQKEIDLLSQLVPHTIDTSKCHKSGTGILCG